MILSGWTQAPALANNKDTSDENRVSTSSQAVLMEAEVDDEIEIVPGGSESFLSPKKRKISDISNAAGFDISSITSEEKSKKKVEELVDDSDLVVLDGNSDTDNGKKKRFQ